MSSSSSSSSSSGGGSSGSSSSGGSGGSSGGGSSSIYTYSTYSTFSDILLLLLLDEDVDALLPLPLRRSFSILSSCALSSLSSFTCKPAHTRHTYTLYICTYMQTDQSLDNRIDALLENTSKLE